MFQCCLVLDYLYDTFVLVSMGGIGACWIIYERYDAAPWCFLTSLVAGIDIVVMAAGINNAAVGTKRDQEEEYDSDEECDSEKEEEDNGSRSSGERECCAMIFKCKGSV